ncbi:hypothetical protein F4677DRAFT_221964 [Hypoxylon crocopeplum]|nr:hypothetical protein F4677DRAFT_221964 [Hypoxylon crocopeplum]
MKVMKKIIEARKVPDSQWQKWTRLCNARDHSVSESTFHMNCFLLSSFAQPGDDIVYGPTHVWCGDPTCNAITQRLSSTGETRNRRRKNRKSLVLSHNIIVDSIGIYSTLSSASLLTSRSLREPLELRTSSCCQRRCTGVGNVGLCPDVKSRRT